MHQTLFFLICIEIACVGFQQEYFIYSFQCGQNSLLQQYFKMAYKKVNTLQITILVVMVLGLLSTEVSKTSNSLSLTIYNNNFGIVKDTRFIKFSSGVSSVFFTDVAKTIQPQTVSFKPVDNTVDISLYEQNYEDNLANRYSVLSKYIGKQITIYVKFGQKSKNIRGILLAYEPAFLLKTDDGINIYDSVQGIQLGELPQGLLTQPTLIWKCKSAKQVSTDFEVAYRATGFSWKADYIVTLSQNQSYLDFAGWVSIDNQSGKRYTNAKLKLIAGDVNIANQYQPKPEMMMEDKVYASAPQPSFQQKSFADYHMYSLSRNVDVNQSSTKQIEFIKKAYSVGVSKFYVISINTGGYAQQKLDSVSTLEFINSKNNYLGFPLPKGTIRVFQKDDDDSLEFIGEDSINHTPVDQKVKIKTGKAFDITSKLIVVNKKTVTNGYDADMRLEINNHGNKVAQFKLELNNYYGDNLKLTQLSGANNAVLKKQNTNKFTLGLIVNINGRQIIEWSESYRY